MGKPIARSERSYRRSTRAAGVLSVGAEALRLHEEARRGTRGADGEGSAGLQSTLLRQGILLRMLSFTM